MPYLITGNNLTPFTQETIEEAEQAVKDYENCGHKDMRIWEQVSLLPTVRAILREEFPTPPKAEAVGCAARMTSFSPSGIQAPFNPDDYLVKNVPIPDTVFPTSEEGKKFDSGKPRFSLVPAQVFEEVLEVLEFGAKKYGADNWMKVQEAETRY